MERVTRRPNIQELEARKAKLETKLAKVYQTIELNRASIYLREKTKREYALEHLRNLASTGKISQGVVDTVTLDYQEFIAQEQSDEALQRGLTLIKQQEEQKRQRGEKGKTAEAKPVISFPPVAPEPIELAPAPAKPAETIITYPLPTGKEIGGLPAKLLHLLTNASLTRAEIARRLYPNVTPLYKAQFRFDELLHRTRHQLLKGSGLAILKSEGKDGSYTLKKVEIPREHISKEKELPEFDNLTKSDVVLLASAIANRKSRLEPFATEAGIQFPEEKVLNELNRMLGEKEVLELRGEPSVQARNNALLKERLLAIEKVRQLLASSDFNKKREAIHKQNQSVGKLLDYLAKMNSVKFRSEFDKLTTIDGITLLEKILENDALLDRHGYHVIKPGSDKTIFLYSGAEGMTRRSPTTVIVPDVRNVPSELMTASPAVQAESLDIETSNLVQSRLKALDALTERHKEFESWIEIQIDLIRSYALPDGHVIGEMITNILPDLEDQRFRKFIEHSINKGYLGDMDKGTNPRDYTIMQIVTLKYLYRFGRELQTKLKKLVFPAVNIIYHNKQFKDRLYGQGD